MSGLLTAHTRYGKRRAALIAAGTWNYRAPVDEVRSHLRTLLDQPGTTIVGISRRSGVPEGTIRNAIAGAVRQVQGATAARILALVPEPDVPRGNLDAAGTRRRLQALTWLGYPQRTLAEKVGTSPKVVWQILYGKVGQTTPEMAARVRRVYDAMSMTPGPSARSRAAAIGHGWYPPLAWDNIDNPAEDPRPDAPVVPDAVDEVLVRRAVAGNAAWGGLNAPERLAACRSMVRAGLTRHVVAERLRASDSTISEFLRVHNLLAEQRSVAA